MNKYRLSDTTIVNGLVLCVMLIVFFTTSICYADLPLAFSSTTNIFYPPVYTVRAKTTNGTTIAASVGPAGSDLVTLVRAAKPNKFYTGAPFLLVLDSQGKPIADMNLVDQITQAYRIYTHLGWESTNYDKTISETLKEYNDGNNLQFRKQVVQGMEWLRNFFFDVAVECGVTLATGGAGTPGVTSAIIANNVSKSATGYAESLVISGALFGKDAQRAATYLWYDLYLKSLLERVNATTVLKNGVIDANSIDLMQKLTSLYLWQLTDGYFYDWRESLYDFSYGAQIADMTKGLLPYKLDKVIDVIDYASDDIKTLQALNPTQVYLTFQGVDPAEIPPTAIEIQSLMRTWGALYDQEEMEGTPFSDFMLSVINSCSDKTFGTIYNDNQAIFRADEFQRALIELCYSPAPITNLTVSIHDYTSVELSWTVPSDDMGAADVDHHEIVYSDHPITNETAWKAAMGHWVYNGATAGTTKTVTSPELQSGREYYFAVRGVDADGNYGPLSNCPKITVGNGINPITLQLPAFPVYPDPGSSFADAHEYSVFYSHAGGMEPMGRLIYIDGNLHNMSRVPGGNYKNGAMFVYRDMIHYAPGSTHTYHYEFFSGPYSKRYPESGEFTLKVDPVLYSASVIPQSSDTYELRTFRVTYRNPEGKWPTKAYLRLSHTQPVEMRMVSGTPIKGAVYEARAYINRENSDYYFDFSDGSNSFRLPAFGTFAADVASVTDVAIVGCKLPDFVECGDVIPVRPQIRNAGTEYLTNFFTRLFINGTEVDSEDTDILSPGMTRSSAVAFEWLVPQSDVAQTYTLEVRTDTQSGETITTNNTVTQTYEVPPGRGQLSGVVYDESGVVPVEGAVVYAVSGTNAVASTTTDSAGTFLLDGIIAGTCEILASDHGAMKRVTGLSVHAGQETVVGAISLESFGHVQHTHFSGLSSTKLKDLQVSPFSGTVGFLKGTRELYLMNPDGSGLRNIIADWDFNISYSRFSFSPTRREVIFYATREDVSPYTRGFFRVEFGADLLPISMTQVFDKNAAGYTPLSPTYIADNKVLYYRNINGTNTLWTMDRNGGSLTEVFDSAPFDNDFTPNVNGCLATASGYVYSLDYTNGIIEQEAVLPSGALYPRLTLDSSRVIFTMNLGDRQVCSGPTFQPYPYIQHTFGSVYGRYRPAVGQNNERLYFVERSATSDGANIMSMPFSAPSAYAYNIHSSCNIHNPIVLNGTNSTEANLTFELNTNSYVTLRILDCQRRLVATPAESLLLSSGSNSLFWTGKDNNGLASDLGVYFATLDVQQEGASNSNQVFHYEETWPIEYGSLTLTNDAKWVGYMPKMHYLFYSDSNGEMYRYCLTNFVRTVLPITNVYTFAVNSNGLLVAHEVAGSGSLDYDKYDLNGNNRIHYIRGDEKEYLGVYRVCPAFAPDGSEFIYASWTTNGNDLMKCTDPGVSSLFLSSSIKEVTPCYSQDGSKVIFAKTADSDKTANIYEIGADGTGERQLTIHPYCEIIPQYISDSNRILFHANWCGFMHQVWTANENGTNPWWLFPVHIPYEMNLELSSDADSLAIVNEGNLRLLELPLHLNKGAIRGRVVDDINGVGLPDITVQAIQGSNIVAATRSNARGYFKLLNVGEGTCDVVAGAGAYLCTSTQNVNVVVADITDIGDLTVIPTPWAALSSPSPDSSVSDLMSVQAQPSERCTHAEFQWRTSTNTSWSIGANLNESNNFTVSFSCITAGWTNGTYQVRAVGYNTSGTQDTRPTAFFITYNTQAPTLTLSTSGSGSAAPVSVQEEGGLAPFSVTVGQSEVVNFTTTFVGDGDGLNTTVFDVRYPGQTNWIPYATRISTNAPDKSFDSAFIPPNMDVEFRVRSYDNSGNIQTSAVIVVRKEIPGDTDGDGMSDTYENAHGLDMNDPLDGEADSDGDGLNNLAESLAGCDPHVKDTDGDGLDDWQEVYCGTSPTNNADCLKTLFEKVDLNEGIIVVKWPSADGRFYSLDRTTNLLDAFSAIATNIPATPPENSYTDTPVNSVSPHFYRIKAE